MKLKRIAGWIVCASLLGFAVTQAPAAIHPSKKPKGPVRHSSARPSLAQRVHDVGNFWTAISNYGNYGDPNAALPSGEWPGGSKVCYIWEGRFWLSAMVGGKPLCSHADYGNYEFDPTDGSVFYFGSGPKSIQDSWVTYDDMTDYEGHTPIGFQVSQRTLCWSLNEYDDFLVFLYEIKNTSGGTLNGAMVTWVFDNDVGCGENGDPDQPHIDDLVDYEGWTPPGENKFRYDWVDPLDLDEDGVDGYDAWGWPLADPRNPYLHGYDDEDRPATAEFVAEPDGVYDEYQIYLVDNGPVIYGQPGTDFEGEPLVYASGDTLKGYLIPRNTSYMYDGDYPQSGENDTGERALSTPVSGFIGTRLLWFPKEPYHYTEDDTFPRPLSHQWWNWESDPGSDEEKYEYMNGEHSLSNGQHFMPHPFDYGAGAPVFDYRYMITTGPYNNWEDGEVKKFVMATGCGQGLKGMRENLDNAMIAYYQGDFEDIGDPLHPAGDPEQVGFTGASNEAIRRDKHFLLPIPPPIPELNYSAGDRKVNLVWDSSAETAVDNFIGTPDFEGYKVYRSIYSTSDWKPIAAFDNIDAPVYLLNSIGDTINPIQSGNEVLTIYDEGWAEAAAADQVDWVKVNLPEIQNSFTDEGGDFKSVDNPPVTIFRNVDRPVNGLKYYYAVAAYDPDKPHLGLFQTESALANYKKTLQGAPSPIVPRPDANITGTDEDGNPVGKVDNVTVVPNPYKGSAKWEVRYEDRIQFMNLPPRCKITVFTMTGDMVKEIYHNSATVGSEPWDLISRNNQKVVSGLYIYAVETPDGKKKVGKFLIIR